MLGRLKFDLNELANEILDKLPVEVFQSSTTTFCDPCMGGGQFVKAIEERLKKYGHSNYNIKNRVFAFGSIVDVKYYKAFGKGVSEPKVLNILEEEVDMKFDVVLGNPPFQEMQENGRKDQASNLWSKFWAKSLEIGNVVALVTPTSWLSPSRDLKQPFNGQTRLWEIFDKHSSVARVTGIDEHFRGVGSSFGYVVVDTNGNEGLSFVEEFDTSLGFLPKSNIDLVTKTISNNQSETIGGRWSLNQSNQPRHRVAVPLTRKVTEESVQILDDDVEPIGAKPELFIYIYCNSEESRELKELIVKNREILNVDCRWSGFMNIKILEKLKVNYVEQNS